MSPRPKFVGFEGEGETEGLLSFLGPFGTEKGGQRRSGTTSGNLEHIGTAGRIQVRWEQRDRVPADKENRMVGEEFRASKEGELDNFSTF